MKHLPLYLAAIVLIVSGACTACGTSPVNPGQLTATEIAPLVESVTTDLEGYVALGIVPEVNADGEFVQRPATAKERDRILGGVVILRNAVAAALAPAEEIEDALEPLPDFTEDPPE
jgi:hypothetical protein